MVKLVNKLNEEFIISFAKDDKGDYDCFLNDLRMGKVIVTGVLDGQPTFEIRDNGSQLPISIMEGIVAGWRAQFGEKYQDEYDFKIYRPSNV